MTYFNIEDYKGDYAMHCKTPEAAREFCDYMASIGRTWCAGNPYTLTTYWETYKKDTVYCFNNNTFDDINTCDMKILEWEDFQAFSKKSLKTGDVILRRNGAVEIVIVELDCCICRNSCFNKLSDITDNLTFYAQREYDIMAVRRPRNAADCRFDAFDLSCGDLVYERDERIEMTLEEICAALGQNIKIVERK